MNANQPYQIIQFAANKAQSGYISPTDYQLIINQAQTSFLDYLLGEFQQYTAGRPLARVQYSMNEITRQRLTPLIGPPVTLSISSSGLAAYPTGFQQVDAMYDPNMNRVRYVPQHKLFSYLNSQIDPISTNPIWLIQENGFQFYPNINYNNVAFSSAKMSYVGTPPTIVWNSTPDANGRPVYQQSGSVDPVWYDTDLMEITARALALVGVNLQIQQVEQYAQIVKNNGQ